MALTTSTPPIKFKINKEALYTITEEDEADSDEDIEMDDFEDIVDNSIRNNILRNLYKNLIICQKIDILLQFSIWCLLHISNNAIVPNILLYDYYTSVISFIDGNYRYEYKMQYTLMYFVLLFTFTFSIIFMSFPMFVVCILQILRIFLKNVCEVKFDLDIKIKEYNPKLLKFFLGMVDILFVFVLFDFYHKFYLKYIIPSVFLIFLFSNLKKE